MLQVNTGRVIELKKVGDFQNMTLGDLAKEISKKEGYSLNDIKFVNSKLNLDDDEQASKVSTVLAIYGDQPITYQLVEQKVQLDHDQVSILADTIDKDKLENLHKVYPFSRNSELGFINVPNWSKELLNEYKTLSKVIEIIKHHNIGGDAMD